MKTRQDYFSLMENQAAFCVRAAELLLEHMKTFKLSEIHTRRSEMHALEHEADNVKHDLMNKLSREFMTPIERDDILKLVQIIDDVTDAIDDVSIKFYMLNIQTVTKDILSLSEVVVRCTRALNMAISELRNFKKSDKLQNYIIEINNIEGEADAIYIEAMRALYTSGQPAITILSLREVCECLETCCDLCEHASDIIESTIMRNT